MRNILFKAGWYDYEEYFHIKIWEQNGRYFLLEEGHNVYAGSGKEKRQITSDEALEIMLEYSEYEQ